ncbi:MAG: DUF4173 domain-containing protein, partial [Microbispora sp.]|nr:DUF4173 domain-containing protein [Microbispora sp.]
LGLAIAKEIVELHGGSIYVADPIPAAKRPEGEGRGTAPGCRMVVVLPRHGEPATGESADGSGHTGKAGTRARKPGMGRPADHAGAAGETGDAVTGPHVVTARAPGARGEGVPVTSRAPAPSADAQAVRGDEEGVVRADDAGAADGREAASSGPAVIAEAGHVRSADSGLHTGDAGGFVRPRADQPYAVPPGRAFVPHAGVPYDRAGHLARAALGAGLGMCGGLFAGLIGSVFLSGYFGGGPAALPLLLFVVAGAVAGAARGSSSARRATARAAGESGPPRHTAEPASARFAPPGARESVAAGPRAPGHAERRLVSPGAPAPGTQGAGWSPPPPVYVPPPLFPRPDLPDAPRWLLPAAASAGLVAAVTLPYAQAGLGFVLTAVVLGAAAFPAVLPLRRGRITPWTVAFGLLAYALVSVVLFRDAEWLVAPVLLAAFVVASLAVSGGGRGWLGVIKGGISVAFALLPLPWFLAGPLRTLTRRGRMLPTLAGAAVTVVLLAVFGLLLSSADAVFSAFLHDLLRAPQWAQSLPLRAFVFCVFAALAGAAVLVGLRPVAKPAPPGLRMSLDRQVWVIPLVGLNLLFAAFVTVQITVLFGGNRRVLSTAGLTYAQYARSGFFELVTVSIFVLGVVAAAVALSRRRTRADRWLLAVLLGLLCAFTLVILASALHRLGLYTDAYGLSRLRASVEATIWWLAAVFVLVPAAGAVRLFGGGISWFFRAFVLLTGVSLLAFAVWDPDARVAETQLTVRGVARLDHGYLSDLGAEAVPILDRLPEPDRSCVLRKVVAVNELDKPDPWNGWNLARARAREVLERRPVLPGGDCPDSTRMPGPYD